MSDPSHSVLPTPLSARFRGTFAYFTVKDRKPVILTKVIDTLHRHRHDFQAQHGQEPLEQLKQVVSELSELRYRLTTDKPYTFFNSSRADHEIWRNAIEEIRKQVPTGEEASFFKSPWLFTECYLYRRIAAALEHSPLLRDWDPFQFQKEQAFVGSMDLMKVLVDFYAETLPKCRNANEQTLRDFVFDWFLISLWGNQYDLSLSAGEQHKQTSKDTKESLIQKLRSLDSFILVNDLSLVWGALNAKTDASVINFVLDNAGMELFGDLCLADLLLECGFAKAINLHVKAMPWFVSDTTPSDLQWTLEMLMNNNDKNLSELACKLQKREEDGTLKILAHQFWTTPHSYYRMEEIAPDLYEIMKQSKLIIFKGDLNYRKLTSDLAWPPETPFAAILRGFAPAPFVVLRTLKAEVVGGLRPGMVERLTAEDKNWMVNGKYAVIQYCDPKIVQTDHLVSP